jgi:hypothetical protein
MDGFWKIGGALLGGAVLGALVFKFGTSGATAVQPRSRKKKWNHKEFDLEYEIYGGDNPRECTAAVQLSPVKGGWKGKRFSAKLIKRKPKRRK